MGRTRQHPDRTTIETSLAATLLAFGGILLGFFVSGGANKWASKPELAILALGLFCIVGGAYVFAQHYTSWLPRCDEA